MKKYKILCYRTCFDEFKKFSNTQIDEVPANGADEFALVSAIDSKKNVGFNRDIEERGVIKALISKCYTFNIRREIIPPSTTPLGYMPRFLFRDIDGEFAAAVAALDKYKVDLARYNILQRHRPVQKPEEPLLLNFASHDKNQISEELYAFLKRTCHYAIIAQVSGEYGYAAFNVFSKNLDFFFDEFSLILDESSELVFVDSSLELPIT